MSCPLPVLQQKTSWIAPEANESRTVAEIQNYPGNTTSLEKRSGGGSSGNCGQWYSDKNCYCDGAMSNRGDSYWGSQEFCTNHVFRNFRGEFYHVKWLPTVKIEYWVGNVCNHDRYIGDNCGDIFPDLIDWCQWSWQGAKGGVRNFDECLWFRFDVNGR